MNTHIYIYLIYPRFQVQDPLFIHFRLGFFHSKPTSKARIVRASGGHGGVHCARPSGHTHAAGSLESLEYGKNSGNP